MLFMIGFAVLSTTALAVSSFAWFTSRKQATFSATHLTVEGGMDFTFYAYKGNFLDNDPTKAVTGYQTSSLNNGFDNDFAQITDSNVAAWTNFQNMYPGDKLSFAVEVRYIPTSTISMEVNTFTSETKTGHYFMGASGNVTIDMAWAMRVYADSSASKTYYTRFIAGEQYELGEGDTPVELEDHLKDVVTFGTAVSTTAGARKFTLIDATNRITSKTTYLFYTIQFSNDSTTWLSEYNSEGTSTIDHYNADADAHYYKANPTSGNSNAFAGLGFVITDIRIG